MDLFTLDETKKQRLLVIIAFITLVIASTVALKSINKSITQRQQNRKIALRIAEYGIQQTLQDITLKDTISLGTTKRDYLNGTCEVKISKSQKNIFSISSSGKMGNVERHIFCDLRKNKEHITPKYYVENWQEK